ncbi:MAG: DUF1998 domain-containing protein [Clostridia bacterium]|nr:DUF1998 domain-containing protein [Clostridia bacterium]
MVVARDGTSLICGGLDHWYEHEDSDGDSRKLDLDEFRVEEWRLQRQLRVDHFRLPPDFRTKRRGERIPNCYLTVPFLRFPQWHFCPSCNYLFKLPLSARGRQKCSKCEEKGKIRYLVQVPFVAMCEYGHIQDFPWREWVHESENPECGKDMRLVATGGATLAGQLVKCECGAKRSLAQITAADPDGTSFLSKNLNKDKSKVFYCQGKKPWLGTEEGEPCPGHLRGSLRSASNVYFAQVRSSIYLPRGTEAAPPELVSLLEEPPLSTLIRLLTGAGSSIGPDILRSQHRELMQPFTDLQIESALSVVLTGPGESMETGACLDDDDRETAFRRAEFNVLRTARDEEMLRIRAANLASYDKDVIHYFSRIMLVDKLRETRVLAGFTRVYAQNSQTPEELRALMWRSVPAGKDAWLPACIVYGEGIFFELEETRLQEWERRDDVIRRVRPLAERYRRIQEERRLQERPLVPRFILLHTLAHLLMNRLTFECGYSSASLRERLYVSCNPEAPMAGVLIYTAAGDAEGTMGGLVRMGKAGYFEPLVRRALEGARWCSADPVCMEMGTSGGQGPDSCNLAACHNCALVPETACEEFNRFLDRALVVGSVDNPGLGFFS